MFQASGIVSARYPLYAGVHARTAAQLPRLLTTTSMWYISVFCPCSASLVAYVHFPL
jgi:hypothetical protein